VGGEIEDCGLIERSQSINQGIGCFLHFVSVAKDARARVNHEGDAAGLRRGVEIGDRLLDPIVENAEVITLQSGNGDAAGSGHGTGHGNHLGHAANRAEAGWPYLAAT
jgi:hypothetical protein